MQPLRLYVRKRPAARIAETKLRSEIENFLTFPHLSDLAIYRRYIIFDEISAEEWERLISGLLTESPVDLYWEDEAFFSDYDHCLAIAPLPAQFDPVRQAAEEGASLILGRSIQIFPAELICLSGPLSETELAALRDYLINPIELMETELLPPFTKSEMKLSAHQLRTFPELLTLTESEMPSFLAAEGLGFSVPDLELIRDYFVSRERVPNELELRVLDTYWSDHCRHTSFNAELSIADFEAETELGEIVADSLSDVYALRRDLDREGELSLMELATLPTRQMREAGEIRDVEFSEEINAATLKRRFIVDSEAEDYLVLFKNETHNHPTEIEPEGGAATCLGGAIRDPLSGRAYVFQAMRVTGASDPTAPMSERLEGKLPQRKICQEAAAGYAAYGNRMGLAASHIVEYYHPDFVAKRFECGAVLGAVPASQVIKTEPEPGDLVVLVGGATGRDGIGGATGSSREQTEESLETASSEVQKGNPINERKLQRLFLKAEFTRLIKRCNDFGAGGVSVAVGELGRGLVIDLDAVPLKYQGLNPLEIALSESQERMAIVIAPEHAETVIKLAEQENLEATVIAEMQADPTLVMRYAGEEVLRLDRSFLDSAGALGHFDLELDVSDVEGILEPRYRAETFLNLCGQLFARLNSASLRGLQEKFDFSVGCTTVAAPYGGEHESSPEMGICAKIPTRGQSDAIAFMTQGYDPLLAAISPWHGSLIGMANALLKVLAMGGDPRRARLSLQEYFPRLEQPEKLNEAFLAMLSAYRAQRSFKVPAIGGKDSVSGTYAEINVPSSVVTFAVDTGRLDHYRPACLPAGEDLTIYAWDILKADGDVDFELYHRHLAAMISLVRSPETVAAFVGGADGLLAALSRACFGNLHGLHIADHLSLEDLSRPAFGTVYLARSAKLAPVEVRALNLQVIASSSGDDNLHYQQELVSLERLMEAADEGLASVYPRAEEIIRDMDDQDELLLDKMANMPRLSEQKTHHAAICITGNRPKVLIPVFPGTNCEFDTAQAFRDAGAQAEIFLVNNLNENLLQESLTGFALRLKACEILALPGGFSAGDEPDGAAKFIRAVFLNDQIRAAFSDHLSKQNLVLGICNGFQALIKLGVFRNNEITELNADDLSLTFNLNGDHVAACATTKLQCKRGPWLAHASYDQIYKIPISHGEGRLIGSERELERLIDQQQIAFVYDGQNPNGSALGIEGLISPNGLILGKMGHSERVRPGLLKNIPNLCNEGIFEAGVKYFLTNS